MKKIFYFALFLPLISFAETEEPPLSYQVIIGNDLRSFEVSACFSGSIPSFLYANDASGSFVRNVRLDTGDLLELNVDLIAVPRDNTARCIFYDVLLEPRLQGEQRGGAETRVVEDRNMLTSIGDWLMRPEPDAQYETFEIDFRAPEDIFVSTPWQRIGKTRFVGLNTPVSWEGIVALTNREPNVIDVSGSIFEVSILGDFERINREDLVRWIKRSAQGVSELMGFFPRPQVQVIVSPSDRSSSVVPWAYVTRGGGAGIHLFVKRDANLEQLVWDWSLPHEMSHFLFPHINSSDYWIIEGLPTYLQHLAMVESGAISSAESWSRLYRGFVLGAKAGQGFTVAESMGRLSKRGTYLHVYWGGAAYFFGIDVELRSRSQGGVTLMDVLRKYHSCCYDETRSISGDQLLADLDSLLNDDLFVRRKNKEIIDEKFPNYAATFKAIGIQFLGNNPVFDENSQTGLSGQIMNPSGLHN
ncbi:MAG: hypothetical protein O3A65_02915 [Proteobacteria bacterium]|nr:hypothetical protein [Pseudomonadota bacterium]